MSVEFYHARSKCGRQVPFIDRSNGSMAGHSCSYHTFDTVRDRICAHFNPRLSVLWGSHYLMHKYEDEIVSLCNKHVPKPLHILLYQPDCDGSLTSNQCRRILKSLKDHSFDDYEDVGGCVIEEVYPWNGMLKFYNNSHLNETFYKCATRYLMNAMRYCAERNRCMIWG